MDSKMTDLSKAAIDVLAERQRQVEAEGWTPEHDDQHAEDALFRAAVCYVAPTLAHVNAFTILMQFTQPKGERLNDQ